jgi:hypothetical protein
LIAALRSRLKSASIPARLPAAVVAVASAWFAFTAVWGMAAIPGGGHLGAGSAGTMMAAEQMIRWRIPYPARVWYTGQAPIPVNYMCHHPYGQYYVPAILYWLFGHHDFLVHLPVVPLSAATPWLLYAITRERLGRPLGAVAAAAYVVVPLAVGFSTYWNLESICIFGALLFFWGHSRHTATSRGRYLAASLAGLGVVCCGDWVGYLIVAPTLGWSFLRAFVLPPSLSPHFRFRPYARWWAASVLMMAASLAWWVGLFAHAGQIDQWLGAGDYRGGGGPSTLAEALRSRRVWIEFSFTPLAITIGKIAAPVCLLRFVASRRDEDTYAPGLLFGAAIQYVFFKKGADVHIFWPHYFAAYFALALPELVATIAAIVDGVSWLLPRSAAPRVPACLWMAFGLLPVAAMAPDAVRSLRVWRSTGGRYDDNGALIRSNVDILYVIQEVILPRTRRGTPIDAHPSLGWGWEFLWKYQGTANTAPVPATHVPADTPHPFWIARASGLDADEQRKIAAGAHVRAYGDAWIVDQREAAGALDAYAVEEREPGAFEWLAYGGTEPVRSIAHDPDPWKTWEWRTHLGQPASLPSGEPTTLDAMRVAHNVAVAGGDAEAAERWRERIDASLDRTVAATFTDGVRLIGVRLLGGAQPRIESWFERSSDEPLGEAYFDVRSTIEARAALSLIPPSSRDRDMAFPPSLPTRLWRKGFLYETEVVLDHRIGRERYLGRWRPRDGNRPPQRQDGRPETTLAVLP